MTECELFKLIKTTEYKTAGDAVDYQIIDDKEELITYLIFQESNGSKDWKNNFNFPAKPYKEASQLLFYHGGYCKAWKSANDVIMNELKEHLEKHYDVYVIGWSLGGAMAVIAAEEIFYRYHIKSILVTFGAPKVCYGKKTVRNVRKSIKFAVQFANRNDIVTYQPPFSFYGHVGKTSVGEKFSLFKIWNPWKYHTMYDNQSLYDVWLKKHAKEL